MSVCEKIGRELEINAPAHKVYKIFKDECFHVPKICPNLIQKVEVHEGNWDTHCHGSIKTWNYTVGMYKMITTTTIDNDDHDHYCFSFQLFS